MRMQQVWEQKNHLLTPWQIWSTFFSFHGIWEEKTCLTYTRQYITWVCDVINWKRSHCFSCFGLMIGFGCSIDPMKPNWQQNTLQGGSLLFHNGIECVYMTWERSAGLPMPVNTMLHYFIIICSYSWPPTQMRFSSRIMYCAIRTKFSRISLMTSDKWCRPPRSPKISLIEHLWV